MTEDIKSYAIVVLWVMVAVNTGFFIGDLWFSAHKQAINKTYIIERAEGECLDIYPRTSKTFELVPYVQR